MSLHGRFFSSTAAEPCPPARPFSIESQSSDLTSFPLLVRASSPALGGRLFCPAGQNERK
jgi:hypothetical protein